MSNPKAAASVIIPTFEDGQFLTACLESVWGQTLAPGEVIVVDDGSSSPQALAGIDQAMARFPETRLLRQPNSGPAAARNLGLAEAGSEFIIFVDADDALAPDSLAMRSALFDRAPGIIATYGGFVALRSDGSEQRSSFRDHLGPIEPAIVGMPGGIPGGLPLYMFRTDALRSTGGLDESLKVMEDFDLLIRLGRSRGTIAGCNQPVYVRNLRPNSLSRGRASQRFTGALKFLRKARRERYFSPLELARRYYHAVTQHLI